MTLGEALSQGRRLLEEAAVPSAKLAADVLLMHALQCGRAHLHAHPERELTDCERVHYARYLRERMSGKPTQYITGRQEFWSLEFQVTPAVLIPRPETEHVVERALEAARAMAKPAPAIADVGTGSGCIAVAMATELPGARIVATDISAAALAVAKQNAAANQVRVAFCRAHLLRALGDASLDMVLSNPPYVPSDQAAGVQREVRDFEPPEAVFAGPDGMDAYTELAPEAARVLRGGGWAIFEVGYNAAERVRPLFAAERWQDVEIRSDLAGLPRVISARRTTR